MCAAGILKTISGLDETEIEHLQEAFESARAQSAPSYHRAAETLERINTDTGNTDVLILDYTTLDTGYLKSQDPEASDEDLLVKCAAMRFPIRYSFAISPTMMTVLWDSALVLTRMDCKDLEARLAELDWPFESIEQERGWTVASEIDGLPERL